MTSWQTGVLVIGVYVVGFYIGLACSWRFRDSVYDMIARRGMKEPKQFLVFLVTTWPVTLVLIPLLSLGFGVFCFVFGVSLHVLSVMFPNPPAYEED